MQEHQTIFSIKEINQKAGIHFAKSIANLKEKIETVKNWQENIVSGKVYNAKEEELKAFFISQFFGDILGYEYKNSTEWNLRLENKTEHDGKKADAALGFFKIEDKKEVKKDVRVVIEIKNANNTLDKPQNRSDFKGSAVEQGFMYAAKSGEKCKWLIVSNFLEIRLYQANDMTKYEYFDILALDDVANFSRFYFLLANRQLFYENTASTIDILLQNRWEKEQNITKEFYAEYQYLREVFFRHLKHHNPDRNSLDLLQYVQTILDRIIFISVIKDYNLINFNVLNDVEKAAELSWERSETKLWAQLCSFFDAVDKGLPPRMHKFNGGLFRYNPEIDSLKIKDFFLKQLLNLNRYDFESDLNINVLGHIFEQSLTDIELLKKEITENSFVDYQEIDDEIIYHSPFMVGNKRKKEGIYYTPEKMTFYIVEQTIGQWLVNKKNRIGINDLEDFPAEEADKQKHIALWKVYQAALNNIKVLDPACGSGAFLTQAFDFLLKEHLIVIDILEKLNGKKNELKTSGLFLNAPSTESKETAKIKKNIVNNNLFGVDLNPESVEITKLGLWLKSASKNDELALLDSNIKCGNSLIDDESVSNKAFNWYSEFDKIIADGGFDAIIGNPPYVSANNMSYQERQFFNHTKQYETLSGKWDLYIPFVEKSLQLLAEDGYFSFIIPYGFLNQSFAAKIRKLILDKFSLLSITDLHEARIFEQATVPTCIPLITKSLQKKNSVDIIHFREDSFLKSHAVDIEHYRQPDLFMFRTERLDETGKLLKKIKEAGVPLGELFYVSTGAEIHGKEFRNEEQELISGYSKFEVLHTKQAHGFKPYIEGADIPKSREFGRYCYPQVNLFLDYDNNFERMRSPKFNELFEKEKIIIRRSSGLLYILATFDVRKLYTSEKCILINSKHNLPVSHREHSSEKTLSLAFLLGIINSKLMNLYYGSVFGGFIDVYPNYLKALPIPTEISKENQIEMEELVSEILKLHKEISEQTHTFQTVLFSTFDIKKATQKLLNYFELDWANLVSEIKKSNGKIRKKQELEFMPLFEEQKLEIQSKYQKIKFLDKKIDNLVYTFYNLSQNEINIIENQ